MSPYSVVRVVFDIFLFGMFTVATIVAPLAIVSVLAVVFRRGSAKSSMMRMAIRAGIVVAVARLSVFVAATDAMTNHSDFRQIIGYFAIMFDALPELAMASALNARHPGSPLVIGVLIVLTSGGIGWVWARLRFRPTPNQ